MKFGKKARNESSIRVRHLEAVTAETDPWRLPWPVTSALAALSTAAVGWILVVGYSVLGWISVPQLKAATVLMFATKGWLLAHGISVSLPGAQVSIMPLGLTIIIVIAGLGICNQAVLHSRPPDDHQMGARLLRMAGVFAVVYLVLLAGARETVESGSGASSLVGAIVFAVLLPLAGFARAVGWRPPRGAAAIRMVALALTAGLLVMIVAGAAVVATALITGRAKVMMIHESLLPGGLGGVMLLLGQLAWLPNLILWAGSWAVGAGIQLGLGTVISPAQTSLGMLPSIPFLGAVPEAGPMPRGCLLWVLSAVSAGAVAAWVLVKQVQTRFSSQGHRLGIDVTALVGTVIGIGCGLAFTLLQLPAGGDLGAVRLTSLGARMTALLVMAPSTMGLAGMATGAVLGWRAAGDQGTVSAGPGDEEAVIETAPIVQEKQQTSAEDELPTTVVKDRSKPAKRDR